MKSDIDPVPPPLPSPNEFDSARSPRTAALVLTALGVGAVIGAAGHAWWAQRDAMGSTPALAAEPPASAASQATGALPSETDWALQARTDASQGRFKASLPAFERAEVQRPKDAQLYADHAEALGYAQNDKSDTQQAGLLAKALEIDPDNVKALVLAGTVALQRQNYGPAVEQLSSAVQHVPADQVELKKLIESRLAEARRMQTSQPIKPVTTKAP